MDDDRRRQEMFIDGTLDYVRTLITDDGESSQRLFSDAQLVNLIAHSRWSPLLGAAQALDIIASSEALLSKKITTQDLTTDGPAVAEALRAHAAALRKQYADEKAEADGEADWGVEVVSLSQRPHRREATEPRWPW